MSASILRAWSWLRYTHLLPAARHDRQRGRRYARVAAAVELALDRHRRTFAARRIGRWLGASASDSQRIFRGCLQSEAREEADSIYFMAHEGALRDAIRIAEGNAPETVSGIYVTLHFGSPILAYLHLATRHPLHAIARRLDASNPMPAAKRRYAIDKVAWVEHMARRPFLYTSEYDLLDAYKLAKEGAALYAAADVPADVVGRTAVVTLFGERVRVASGVLTLAHLARAPVRPVVGVSANDGIDVYFGDEIRASSEPVLRAATFDALAGFIRRFPQEWWLWPYLPSADGS